MRLRHGGHPLELERQALRLALPQATGKLVVLVHGSCLNDRQWTRQGTITVRRSRAISGSPRFTSTITVVLHISTNGREFAALLERLVAAWPRPLDELVIVAHSMGGLVARSACHFGEMADHAGRPKLRKLVCLGSPHHGAPLERGGHWIDLLLGASRYSAPLARLGQIRSAGVTDMRFGNVMDEHWAGAIASNTPAILAARWSCPTACSATRSQRPSQRGRRQVSGDGLVPVDSALGRHAKPELTLGFPETHQWIAYGMGHLDLLGRAEVYEKIPSWPSS